MPAEFWDPGECFKGGELAYNGLMLLRAWQKDRALCIHIYSKLLLFACVVRAAGLQMQSKCHAV